MILAQTLLDRNMRVCSTMRANRGIPHDLEAEGKCLIKEKSAFGRNGDVMVQVWYKTCANDATVVNKGKKDRNTNVEIKKPYAVGQYNKFIRGVDRADQYLTFFCSEEKCKMVKKSGTASAKLCSLQHIFCVQDTK